MTVHLAASVLAGPVFDPNESVGQIRALLILLIAVALLVVSLVAATTAGRRGNVSKAFNITGATLIALIPAVIAVGVGALAFGAAFFGWLVPGISK